MRRAGWVVLTAVVVAVVAEVGVLAWLVGQVGAGWTVLILAAGAALGGWAFRREGRATFRRLFEQPESRQEAGNRVTDAMLVVVGGLLLLFPGLISDAFGLVCLLPFTRPLARRVVQAALRPFRDRADLIDVRLNPGTVIRGETVTDADAPGGRRRPDDPTVIRGEVEP